MKWTKKVNRRYQHLLLFLAAAVLVVKVISQVADHAPEIFGAFMTGLGWLIKVAKPIIFGFVMAYILQPLNDFLTEKYGKVRFLKKTSRLLAVFTVLILFVAVIIAIVSAIVYSVTHQLQVANVDELFDAISSLAKSVTDFYDSLMAKLGSMNIHSVQIADYLGSLSESVMNFLQKTANSVIGSVSNISGVLTTIMFGLIIGIYFMLDGSSIVTYFSDVADALLPDKANVKLRSILRDLDEVFSGYIRGQLMDVMFMIVATTAAMMLTGISLAPIIGLLTGLANLVPYLGPFVGYASIILISVVEGRYSVMVVSLIALFVIQTLDGNVIEAKLVGKSIKVHPLLVLIFLIFGNAIGGLWGMLLAVPVGAFIQKIFTNYVERQKNAKRLAHAQKESVVNEPDESAEYVENVTVEK